MIDIDERIRRAAALLDEESSRVSDRPGHLVHQSGDNRSLMVPIAAGLLALAGLGGAVWLATQRDGAPPSSTAAPTTASGDDDTTAPIEPAATLPPIDDLVDVPITVMGSGPTDWYRLQPDLDVAWHGDGTLEGSQLCFRTVDGQDCQADDLYPSDIGGGAVGIPSRDGQWLIVTVDPEPTVTVEFDNGETATAPVERDSQSALGVARLDMAEGAAPVGLKLLFRPS